MAYFTTEKLEAAATVILESVEAGVECPLTTRARQYIEDWADYLEMLVEKNGILVDGAAYREHAAGARRVARMQNK